MIDETGILYRVKDGDLWGVGEVRETSATLFCVEPCEETMRQHWQFLEDNRHTPEDLRGDMFKYPRGRTMEVDLRWFERSDVSRVTCDHSRDCYPEGDGLFCNDCGAEPVPEKPEDCPCCGGDGWHGDGEWCACPKGKAEFAEAIR